MRLIYDGPESDWDEAMTLLSAEMVNWRDRYTKTGWGWTVGRYEGGSARFFVRRIKDGLSIKRLFPAESRPSDLAAQPTTSAPATDDLALIIGVGGEGASRTNSSGSPAQEPAKSDGPCKSEGGAP